MARRVTDIDELLARATERGPYVASVGKTGSSGWSSTASSTS